MTDGPSCPACGRAHAEPVRFCPFCGVAQHANVVPHEPVPASEPAPPSPPAAPAQPRPSEPPAPRPAPPPRPASPVAGSVPPAGETIRRGWTRSGRRYTPAPPPPPPVRLKATPGRARRHEPMRRQAIRRLWLALLLLGGGALFWRQLTAPAAGPDRTTSRTALLVRLPAGADGRVLVDGEPAGRPDRAVPVSPGQHEVGLDSPSWRAPTRRVRVEAGETRIVDLAAVARAGRLSVAAGAGVGRFSVRDDAGRVIWRDVAAPFSGELAPGRYVVAARGSDDQAVTVLPGQTAQMTLAARAADGQRRTLVAPPAGRWSVPVPLAAGDRFWLRFADPIRIQTPQGPVLLEGTTPADLGGLDLRSVSVTAVGDTPVTVTLLVRPASP
jgi:hypothetical protein